MISLIWQLCALSAVVGAIIVGKAIHPDHWRITSNGHLNSQPSTGPSGQSRSGPRDVHIEHGRSIPFRSIRLA